MDLPKTYPKFVTIEGVEGSGKTTLKRNFIRKARQESLFNEDGAIFLREPGGCPPSEAIRGVLLNPELEITPTTELLLYLAARASSIEQDYLPRLHSGKWVFCDRFHDSTIAYQAFGRELGGTNLEKATNLFYSHMSCHPGKTYLIDLDPVIGFERLNRTGKDPDRIEAVPLEFHQKVRAGYLVAAERDPKRIMVIDGDRSPEKILEDVYEDFIRYMYSVYTDYPTQPQS